MKLCEMCDGYDAKRREDNLYVCDKCNKEYPYDRLIRVVKTRENK